MLSLSDDPGVLFDLILQLFGIPAGISNIESDVILCDLTLPDQFLELIEVASPIDSITEFLTIIYFAPWYVSSGLYPYPPAHPETTDRQSL
jgi:hypothetical protein